MQSFVLGTFLFPFQLPSKISDDMLKVPLFCSSRCFIPPFHPFKLLRSSSAAAVVVVGTSDHRLNVSRASSSASTGTQSKTKMESEHYTFGPYKIGHKEVFYSTDLSYAMVNLRPILAGESQRREVKRFIDLTTDETSDLWLTAKRVGDQLESYHKASSLTFGIQDGPQAGQTVPHVHIHIIPRKTGDFEKNDEIYEAIDEKEKELKQKLDLDEERKDRTPQEMAQEADEYRKLFL